MENIMKENYAVPDIDVIKFNAEDMILMSGIGDNDGEIGGDWEGVPD